LLCIFSAASLVLLVGFTRIALGAHFLTDVLAAIFFGIIWLMCARFSESPFDQGPLRQRRPPLMARNYSAELAGVAGDPA